MIKPVATLAAAGIVGVVVAKFLWMLVLPIVGVVTGVLALIFKVVLIVFLIWLGYKILGKMTERPSEG